MSIPFLQQDDIFVLSVEFKIGTNIVFRSLISIVIEMEF